MNIDYEKMMFTLKKHAWGPVGSVFFHVLGLVLLIQFSVGVSTEKAPEVEVTMMETKAEVLEKVEEVVKQELEKPPEQEVVSDRPTDATVSTMEVPSDAPGSGLGNSEGAGIGSGDPSLATGFEIAMAKSPLVMRGLYAQRTAGGRKGALSAFGGSGRGEDAVLRALRWLKANQDENGSWSKVDSTSLPAMAGLALLTFLAHGETPSSPEFGATVEKAMKYIVSKQNAKGNFSGNPYEHGICTYAIAEGFGLTKIMALKEAMEKGIQVIIDGQQTGGGFDYGYAKGPRWDLSVAGWQFQAMKAAKMAGSSNPGLDGAIASSIKFLRNTAHQPTQGFGYSGEKEGPSAGSTPSMTGAGTLCLQLMGKPDSPEVRSGLKWMNETKSGVFDVTWEREEADKGKAAPKAGKNPVYAWYYITQAKFQKGESDWKEWNPKFTTALVRNQIVEGKLGHWENGDHGGKVYTTALCTLMLEVYYRYLPTFKHVEVAAPATAVKSDDVVVDVK
ncbi:MAG: prenyltransferase/squalene oxidase repeat-containing protein [bacterium]